MPELETALQNEWMCTHTHPRVRTREVQCSGMDGRDLKKVEHFQGLWILANELWKLPDLPWPEWLWTFRHFQGLCCYLLPPATDAAFYFEVHALVGSTLLSHGSLWRQPQASSYFWFNLLFTQVGDVINTLCGYQTLDKAVRPSWHFKQIAFVNFIDILESKNVNVHSFTASFIQPKISFFI